MARCCLPTHLLAGIGLLAGCGNGGSEPVERTAQAVVNPARSVLTQRNNNARDGAYASELSLNPTSVTPDTFGRIYERIVPGAISAQVLYVAGVDGVVGTVGPKNLMLVVSEQNYVFAYDADNHNAFNATLNPSLGNSSRTGLLWAVGPGTLGPPSWGAFINDFLTGTQNQYGEGALSTPVIDAANNRIYLVVRTAGAGTAGGPFRLFVLDLRSGASVLPGGGYVPIDGTTVVGPPGSGAFDPTVQLNRPGLLLDNSGTLYVAFGAPGRDAYGWHGWLLAYPNASVLSASSRPIVWQATPGWMGGGLWQAGVGISTDDVGNIFAATGNGQPEQGSGTPFYVSGAAPAAGTFGNSIVRLNLDTVSSRLNAVGQYYPDDLLTDDLGGLDPTPTTCTGYPGGTRPDGGVLNAHVDRQPPSYSAYATAMNSCHADTRFPNGGLPTSFWQAMEWGDADLSSSGVVLLPDSPTSSTRSTLIGGGKAGVMYVVNAGLGLNLPSDRWQSFQATYDQWDRTVPAYCYALGAAVGPHVHGAPIFWRDDATATRGHVFVWAERDVVRDYPFDYATRRIVPDATILQGRIASGPAQMPGGVLALSWDGTYRSSAIVWGSIKESEDFCRCPGRIIYMGLCAPNMPPWASGGAGGPGNCGNLTDPGRLYAFRATDLSTPLWSDSTSSNARFNPPTIADGLVMMPTWNNRVNVYTAASTKRLTRGLGANVTVVAARDGVYTQYHAFAVEPVSGQLYTTWWSNRTDEWSYFSRRADAWHLWHQIPNASGAADAQQVAAVLTGQGANAHLDLFYVTTLGKVMTAWWDLGNDAGSWHLAELSNKSEFSTSTAVTAIVQGDATGATGAPYVTLFALDATGHVATRRRSVPADASTFANWSTAYTALWASIGGAALPATTPLSAVARSADGTQADLFFTDAAGQVWTSTTSDSITWSSPVMRWTGMASGAPITAIRRLQGGADNHLDIFAVTSTGRIVGTPSDGSGASRTYPGFSNIDGGVISTASPRVEAFAVDDNTVDLYIVQGAGANQGQIWTDRWTATTGWRGYWASISDVGAFVPNRRVTALRFNDASAADTTELIGTADASGATGNNLFTGGLYDPSTASWSWYNAWMAPSSLGSVRPPP